MIICFRAISLLGQISNLYSTCAVWSTMPVKMLCFSRLAKPDDHDIRTPRKPLFIIFIFFGILFLQKLLSSGVFNFQCPRFSMSEILGPLYIDTVRLQSFKYLQAICSINRTFANICV